MFIKHRIWIYFCPYDSAMETRVRKQQLYSVGNILCSPVAGLSLRMNTICMLIGVLVYQPKYYIHAKGYVTFLIILIVSIFKSIWSKYRKIFKFFWEFELSSKWFCNERTLLLWEFRTSNVRLKRERNMLTTFLLKRRYFSDINDKAHDAILLTRKRNDKIL